MVVILLLVVAVVVHGIQQLVVAGGGGGGGWWWRTWSFSPSPPTGTPAINGLAVNTLVEVAVDLERPEWIFWWFWYCSHRISQLDKYLKT